MLVPLLGIGFLGAGAFVFHKRRGNRGSDQYVLEVKRPWSRRLVQGEKTIEVRKYELPRNLIGRPIEILETRGSAIVSKVPDIVDPSSEECDDLNLVLAGTITVSGCKEYKTEAEFNADAELHLASNSEYAWKAGTKCFGW
eukprot:CAMPEP_0114238600 /NCGR_PEP_ID=MMETSP0058-20121206/8009_1 /TAXON_ID=36894 /ORGANISM="Pyramimonas parkeae, CCMP726" /LENGTH=140 /DNA_ID=CAMNT_0001350717 /DNA_START=204 /DNA_END=623 /DNA_ORIENTATION=+